MTPGVVALIRFFTRLEIVTLDQSVGVVYLLQGCVVSLDTRVVGDVLSDLVEAHALVSDRGGNVVHFSRAPAYV